MHEIIKITHKCRRRGVLGTSQDYVKKQFSFFMGPCEGIYKIVEPCPEDEVNYYEMHWNDGPAGCKWVKYAAPTDHPLDEFGNDLFASLWIKDRARERRIAMIELQMEANSQMFHTDGN